MPGPRTRSSLLIAAVAASVAGCNGGDNDNPFVTGETAMPTVTVTASTTVGNPSGTDTDTDTDTGPSTDTTEASSEPPSTTTVDPATSTTSGTDTDSPTSGTTDGTTTGNPIIPCLGVDVLFVIDNSVGMGEEQTRVNGTAEAFVDSVAAMVAVPPSMIHVGVMTTDEPELVVPVDMMGVPTTYVSTANWMVWDKVLNPMVGLELTTALAVGEAGSVNERPMDMLVEAVSGATSTGFNDGFVEEDSLLVIVLITDEEDDIEQPTLYGSDGDPSDWVDGVASIKDGIRKDVVVLGLVPTMSACADDLDSPRLTEFTTSFPAGAVHDVCDLDYSAFLLGAVPALANACMQFSPP